MNVNKLKEKAEKITIFLAYNANIDAIVRIKDLKKIFSKEDFKKATATEEKIKTKQELLAEILKCMNDGIGREKEITDEIGKWIKENIAPREKRIGGQIGIMANALSNLGFKCLVYFPLLSEEQSKFFNRVKNLKFLTKDGWKESGYFFKNSITKINWIFEFSKGDELFGIKAKENNRFIAALRPDEDRIKSLLLTEKIEEINKNSNLAILSGYHDLKEEYSNSNYIEELSAGEKIIEKLRMPIKLELGHISNEKIRKGIIEKIAPKADVISMDTRELESVLELLNKKIKLNDVISYYEALKIILESFNLKCVEIHKKDYFLSLVKDYVDLNKIKKGYEIARDFQYLRSEEKEISWENLKLVEDKPVSVIGVEAGKKLENYLKNKKNKINAVVVPNKVNPNPKITVGLGDIVSSISFVIENIGGIDE